MLRNRLPAAKKTRSGALAEQNLVTFIFFFLHAQPCIDVSVQFLLIISSRVPFANPASATLSTELSVTNSEELLNYKVESKMCSV